MKDGIRAGRAGQGPPRGWLRFALRAPILLYRLKLGWLLGRRFLLLKHIGRNSGATHSTVLEVVRHERASHLCIIASGWGTAAQWYKNVLKNPDVRYTVGVQERAGRVEQLPVERAEQELRDYGERHPTAIRNLTKFMIGEQFENSAAQYRRLAIQVPVLQVTPRLGGGDSA